MTTSEVGEFAAAFDEVLSDVLTTDALLASAAGDSPPTPDLAGTLAEVGFPVIRLTEEQGGLDAGPDLLAALMIVAGRRLLPTVLRDEALLVAPLLAAGTAAGDTSAGTWLTQLTRGGGPVAVRVLVPGLEPGRIEMGPDTIALENAAVRLGPTAEALMIVMEAGAGIGPLEDLSIEHHRGVEPGQGAAKVSGSIATFRLTGDEGVIPAALCSWQLGLIAEALGICDEMTRQSVAYANEREQFGKPISSFQAVSHLLADMKERTEVIRSVVGRLVSILGAGDDPDALLTASRFWVPRAAREVCETAIQVHGGMGFTWELGIHLYYRRALHLQAVFGGAVAAAEAVGNRYLEYVYE